MNLHINRILAALFTSILLCTAVHAAQPPTGRIPVILDTDIGDDIDDTWALGLILRSAELDLKLVVGDNYKGLYRAKLLAKFLQAAGRTDVPVGIGLGADDKKTGGQAKWVADYDLSSYPGKVHQDGVQALIDTIMSAQEPITVIAIGPVQNLAEALKREPRIGEKARFVGMHGSVRKGYDGGAKPSAEYNVKEDAKACQKVFTGGWDMTITPLDTCGLVRLRGGDYARVRDAKNPIARAIIENYRIWSGNNVRQADSASSVLFDTVAVYLSFSHELCTMEQLHIRVTDSGMTVIDPQGKSMWVATEWKDLAGYERLLSQRLAAD